MAVASGDLDGLVPAPRWAARHMADNDLAYMLADVKAERAIVDRFARSPSIPPPPQ